MPLYDTCRYHDYFSESYREAREKFLSACSAARCETEHNKNPATGPGGGELFTDVARFGSKAADKVLITVSGVHGPEGHAGSAAQIAWVDTAQYRHLPEDIAVVCVHAANPFGFAWTTRTNEDGVDVNRNFRDFPLKEPINPEYNVFHPFLVPEKWDDETAARAKKTFRALEALAQEGVIKEKGVQSVCPDGLGYVGNAETWSNKQLRRIIQCHAGSADKVVLIDYHTGIEPYGHMFFFCNALEESALGQRITKFFGGAVKFRNEETVELNAGQFFENVATMLPDAEVTPVLLEFSGRPESWPDVAPEYHWQISKRGLDHPETRAAACQYRDIFYQNEDDEWKEHVIIRSLMFSRRVIDGLATG